MMGLGNHAGFIIAAYLAAIVVLVGLVGWVVRDGRALKRQLADLESRGIRRRSAKGGGPL
jgi:heme exporter protein D